MSYAVIDDSVRRRTDPYCYQLYGFLDGRQISKRTTGLGIRGVVRGIGWARNTVRQHLYHLTDLDLVETLIDGTISVKTNAVRHRGGGSGDDPPPVRDLTHLRSEPAPKECAGETKRDGSANDPPGEVASNHVVANPGYSRDALVEQPRSKGNGERNARVTGADPSARPRPFSACRCGQLLLTATDHRAGMCVFCRDELEVASATP